MNAVHYADDSMVYMMGDSFDSLLRETDLNQKKIDRCLCANKLVLNISESQFCMFSNIHCDNSSGLQLRDQVQPQCFKNRISHFIPKKPLHSLYYSLIYLHLT